MGNCQTITDGSAVSPTSKSKGSSHIIVTTFTWARDSHGLFDYESKSLTKKAFKAQGTGVIRRSTNDIGFTKDSDKTAKLGDKDLLKLNLKQGSFWINACGEQDAKLNKEQTLAIDPGSLEQDPWLVIKSLKNNTNKGYKLNEGDLIKLGRVKYRIREMKGTPTISNQKNYPEKQVVNTEVDNNNSVEESFKKSPRVQKESQGNLNQACRICLSETTEPDNPFFSPCNCSGTMKLIHVKCLQTWLKSKLHSKITGHTTFIYWKSLECELCKTPYPQCFEVEGKKYDIVEIERPDCAYIVLEVLSKEKNFTKGVHIIKMEGKSNIRLGRGHDSDIRITDISVSRCHAIIKLDKGNYYVEDNNSKFGTLLHLSKPVPLTGDYNNVSVQIGRTVVSLTVKKGKGMFPLCFGGSGGANSALNDKNLDGNGIFPDLNQNEPRSPLSPLSPHNSNNNNTNRSVLPRNASNRTIALNVNNRNYLFDITSSAQNIQNLEAQPQLENHIHNLNVDQILEPIQPIEVQLPNLSENEGNIGQEADERSYYSPSNN